MKAAGRIALLAASIAAVGIVLTCTFTVSMASSTMLDAVLRAAADDFRLYCSEAERAASQSGVEVRNELDATVLRYVLQTVPGSGEYAVEIDSEVLFNDTGLAACEFLLQHGAPYGESGLVYGLADTAQGPRLALGFGPQQGERSSRTSICLVRDVSETAVKIQNLIAQSVATGGVILCACILAIFAAVQRMMRPVKLVGSAMSLLAGGFYGARVNVSGKDEFAQLATDCNCMSSAISDKVHELDQLAEDRQFLLRALAHEIRTPVTALCAYTETLQTLPLTDVQRSNALNVIRNQGRRLGRLAAKMTQLVGVDTHVPELESVEASQLEDDLSETLPPIAAASTLHISADPTASYQADPDLLVELVGNLVQNASRASADHITVSLEPGRILVSDDGCGIAPEHLPRVLEPFYQVDASRSRQGFGLGLTLAARIAALHSASLSIESEPGRGTQVVLAFRPAETGDSSIPGVGAP